MSRRVLVLLLVALAVGAAAGASLRRCSSEPTDLERARDEAERIRERVRDLTH